MTVATQQSNAGARVAATAIGAGALVAVVLGVFANAHEADIGGVPKLGFATVIDMKVWLALVVGVLVVLQLLSALWMYGRFGGSAPSWIGLAHRSLGAVALVVSLPVAFACLYGLGFSTGDLRVLVHSTAGCLVYGAFVAKVVGLHSRRAPGWLVTWAAGVMFTLFVLLVLTSAIWYLGAHGLPPGP